MPSQGAVMTKIPQDGGPEPLAALLEHAPGGMLWLVLLVIGALMHVALAVVVFVDARKRRTELMPPAAWALLAFAAGLMGLLIYWLVNREVPRRQPR